MFLSWKFPHSQIMHRQKSGGTFFETPSLHVHYFLINFSFYLGRISRIPSKSSLILSLIIFLGGKNGTISGRILKFFSHELQE